MTKSMTNQDIIQQFRWAAAVNQAQEANPFIVRAYQNAIESIENLDEELSDYVKHDKPETIPGIGHDLSLKIIDLVETGKSESLDKLFTTVPEGMFPLLDVPGIGSKKAFRLATTFHLDDKETSLKKLKQVAEQDKISQLDGFGAKSQQQILQNLDQVKPKSNRIRIDQADKISSETITILKNIDGVEEALPLGSLRRRNETIGDVDIGVKTDKPEEIIKKIKANPAIEKVTASGNNLIRIVLKGNYQIDIKFQTPDKWGATLQHFTGSKAHNVALRELALKKSMSLSEHGIKIKGKLTAISSEEDFYNRLNLEYLPPELRENSGEIQAAAKSKLPKLVSHDQIKGDLHTHTDFQWRSSHDYGMAIQQLFQNGTHLGYHWIAIGDHNPSQSSYTESETIKQIDKRNAWIEQQYSSWKQQVKNSTLKILNTLEVDIKPNGELAVPDKGLNQLDFVIASVHSSFNQSQTDQTERIVRAISHPKVKILGHPTGRLINQRLPMSINWNQVFKTCKEYNVALEINADPHRLDLPDTLVKQAKQHKIKFVLGTDAHHQDQLLNMHYGVSVARRAWLEPRDIINTYSFDKVTAWLQT